MRRIAPYGFLLAAVLLVFQGCGKPDPGAPPKVRYGLDVCTSCRMIIAEPRFTAAAATEAGELVKFDDIGCMARYGAGALTDSARLWVHDFLTEAWIDGRAAVYVHSEGLVTPMGYGLAAFNDHDAAKKFSEERKGRVVSWQETAKLVENNTHE